MSTPGDMDVSEMACAGLTLRLDCRHYRGDRPCAKGCRGSCEHYEPMGRRILLIKLGALGDVIRTEALLPGLKDALPESHITWVSQPNGCRMLANNPLIDRLLEFDAAAICHLQCEHFDWVINLDKEPAPAGLAMRVPAAKRGGIGLTTRGAVYPLNPEAAPYFAMGLSDELKFHGNPSSYQRLIYEALGLTYRGQRYALFPSSRSVTRARAVFEDAGVGAGEAVIGLNTGAGSAFANKTWPAPKFIELARRLAGRGDCRVALLGGPVETEVNDWIAGRLGAAAIHTGTDHEELDFAAIVQRCRAVLTGDTTAMHVAIAMGVPVVVLFGPTCPQEIDLYGRGTKLISQIPCAPCYRRQCDYSPNCMDEISVEAAEKALVAYLGRGPARPMDVAAAGPCDPPHAAPRGMAGLVSGCENT